MSHGIRSLLIVGFVFLLAPLANATPIVLGTYSGTWQQFGVFGTLTMTVQQQTPVGANKDEIVGVFDWLCVTGTVCSGQELFKGTLIDTNLTVAGFALQNNVNLLLAFYTATVSPHGNDINGTFSSTATGPPVGTWTVSGVPEPSTVFLLAVGIIGLIGYSRRPRSTVGS